MLRHLKRMKKPHTQVRYSWNENDFKYNGDPNEFKKRPKNIVLPNYIEELKIQEPLGFLQRIYNYFYKVKQEKTGFDVEKVAIVGVHG
ncbi:hypothetical protein HDV01_001349 [Terramyces sp. JEL0728]|nr:hypothetical protein HDV01_001349 [Terramyces sp. JEL0728]